MPDELKRRQDRVAKVRQARKEQAEKAQAKANSGLDADPPADEQPELTKTETAGSEPKAALEKANEAVDDTGMEPPDLEPLAEDAMPMRGLAKKADGSPKAKTQRNFTDANGHLMSSGGAFLQGYNGQLAVDSDQRNKGRCPEMPMPEPAWPTSSKTKMGGALYTERKSIVEPVNGQINEGRGLRRFLLRGLEKVDGEWYLISATHNLLKFSRNRR